MGNKIDEIRTFLADPARNEKSESYTQKMNTMRSLRNELRSANETVKKILNEENEKIPKF